MFVYMSYDKYTDSTLAPMFKVDLRWSWYAVLHEAVYLYI